MLKKLKPLLISGSASGLLLVLGEGILNAVLLKNEWGRINHQLGLAEPSQMVVALALAKLFVLGFVVMWLYDMFCAKYGKTGKSALLAGLFVGLLIWGWALAGLWLGGYINTAIAIPTFLWGIIELPVIALIGGRLFNKFAT